MWLTMGLAIERYFSMRRVGHIQQRCTEWRLRSLLAGLVLFCAVVNIQSVFVVEVKSNGSKGDTKFGRSSYYAAFSIARLILFTFGSFFVILCFNALLIRVTLVQRQKRIRRQLETSGAHKSLKSNQYADSIATNNTPATTPSLNPNANSIVTVNANRSPRRLSPREKAEYKLTIMCIAMIVIFLMGHVPVAFSYARVYGLFFGPIQTPQHKLFSRVTLAISVLAFTLNFWMYVTLNRRFRDALFCRSTAKERALRSVAAERTTMFGSSSDLRGGGGQSQAQSLRTNNINGNSRSNEKIIENGV